MTVSRAGGPLFKGLAGSRSLPCELGVTPIPNFENSSEEECFFGPRIGDAGFFLASCQLEVVFEKAFDSLFDLLRQRAAATYSDQPIIGITEIL